MTMQFHRRGLMAAAGATAVAASFAGKTAFAQDAAAAPKPEAWAKASAVQFPGLSPDGMHIAYLIEDAGTKSIVTIDIAAQKPSRINIGTATVVSMTWLDDSHVLVITTVSARAMGGAADAGSYWVGNVFDVKSNKLNVLYHEVPAMIGIVTGDLFTIRKDGKTMVTASGMREDRDQLNYLYGFDLDTGKGTLLDVGPEDIDGRVLAQDGTLVGRSAYYYHTRAWVVEYYNGSGWKEIHRQTVERNSPSLIGLAADGKSLVVLMPDDGDIGTYRQMAPDGTLSDPLMPEDGSHSPVFHNRTYRMAGVAQSGDWTSYAFSDPALAALNGKAQTAMADYRMDITDYGDDAMKAIIYSEGEDDAGTYYYINFTTGLTFEIGAQYPDIPVDWIADKTAITYAASDGIQIEAMLALPPHKDAKGLALVVMPHSGWGRNGLANDWFVEMFTTAGYAVLQPNFRGSAGYGQAFITAGDGQMGGKMLTDLSDGVAFLAAQGTIDAKRVCILGSNVPGGYLALAGVALQQGIYTCAVDLAGMSDVSIFMSLMSAGPLTTTDPDYQRYLRRFGDPTTWDAISPVRHAASVNVPVLIIHSMNEPGMNLQQSQKMADALKGAGKDVTLVKPDNTDSWRLTEAWRLEVVGAVLPFLAKNNPA